MVKKSSLEKFIFKKRQYFFYSRMMRKRTESLIGVSSFEICDEYHKKASDIEEAEVVFEKNFLEEPKGQLDKVDNDCCDCNCFSTYPCSCSTTCCRGVKCFYRMTRLQLALIISLAVLLLTFAVCGIVPFDHRGQPIRPLSTALPTAISKERTRVLLYGDSQWGIVERYHHLTTKIQAYLPEYPMDFTVVGDLGVKARNLNQRLPRYMNIKPHVVLINLDSDCSNVNEDILSIQQRQIVRDDYRGNISAVVKAWLKTGALVALGGPGLLGEGPLRPMHVERFKDKDRQLNAYVEINKEVAAAFGIPFMDFRAKLFSAVPWWRFYYNGYVTKDGEHPNERGAVYESKMMATVMLDWFQNRNQWNLVSK